MKISETSQGKFRLEREALVESPLPAGKISEADMPVPNILPPASRALNLLRHMKLSQKIGYLLFLHRRGDISDGGVEALFFLQEKAPFEALSAGLKFAELLDKSLKLQSDFKRAAELLDRRPRSWRFRNSETRRIGVGYRDKGTLPEISPQARKRADQESFIFLADLPCEIVSHLQSDFPACLTEDVEWLDLSMLIEHCSILQKENIRLLLSSL